MTKATTLSHAIFKMRFTGDIAQQWIKKKDKEWVLLSAVLTVVYPNLVFWPVWAGIH